MRLFLLALGMLALCGCDGAKAGAGAVRVEIFYATFHPGCLTVTALDEADVSRTETQQLTVEDRNSDAKTVAVFRKPDWSRRLQVIASAHEGSCSGPEVATSSQRVEVPTSGSRGVYLDLRAEDLDGDGFVAASASGKGTDCDDTDAAVHPGAPETCDGKDSNCSGDEEDATTGKRGYYVDADGDGHGDASRVVMACARPAGTALEPGDCDDTDPTVYPAAAELRCDGKDDNCDGSEDEIFLLGSACETVFGCEGVRVCGEGGFGVACDSAQMPVTWYSDGDGDGLAGTLATFSCEAPAGATSILEDCDDTSRFVGGPEVCDQLDNDCNGAVDEGDVCATSSWTTRTLWSTNWEAVTTYAPGKAWLAGPDGWLAHVSDSTVTEATGVCGTTNDWKVAWARPSDGRVFLGAAEGTLATARPMSSGCTTGVVSGVPGTVTGITGFERSGTTTVYAVTSSGHVLRWDWQETSSTPPVMATRLAANLRSVHGLGPDALLAVGAEDFQPGSAPLPRAFRFLSFADQWIREELPADVGTGYLRGVSVVDGARAYAVGDHGLVLEREAGTWRKLTAPGGAAAPELLDVAAFHPSAVYVLSNQGGTYLHRFDGTAWSEPFPQNQVLLTLDAISPRELWSAGQGGTLVRWGTP